MSFKIPAYGSTAFTAYRTDTTFRSLKDAVGQASNQLTSGKVADTYAGLGANAPKSLSARARLATLGDYTANIKDAQTRISFMSLSLTQIGKLSSALSASLPASPSQPIGQTTAQTSADDGLKQTIDMLNQQVGGRYLFSGRTGDTEPVKSYDLIMNGDATHAGLKQMITQRKAADLGTAGLGRLALTSTGTTNVTLSEEAAGLPFGMKIGATTATGAGITATPAAGPPVSVALDVAAQPAQGDTVEITLNLPDGTNTKVTLTAGSTGTGGFAIGATPDDTATNLNAALQTALANTAATALSSASTIKASKDFFAGSATNPPMRVAGPPYDTATAQVAGTAANTVIWYVGDDGTDPARGTATVRTGDSQSVSIGARANEPAFQALMASLGALAAETFPNPATTQGNQRYSELAGRVMTTVGASGIEQVTTDFSVASKQLGDAKTRTANMTNQMQDIVDGVENIDPNEVAMKLMETQTRLQASYQTTSIIAKLSLVNFLT